MHCNTQSNSCPSLQHIRNIVGIFLIREVSPSTFLANFYWQYETFLTFPPVCKSGSSSRAKRKTMAGRERSRVKLLHHKCTSSSTCFCKKRKTMEGEEKGSCGFSLEVAGDGEGVQDACSYLKKMFVAPLPFHLSLIKPSLRRGQVKRCPGPWVEIGLTS